MPPWEKYATANKPKGPWEKYSSVQEVAQPAPIDRLFPSSAGSRERANIGKPMRQGMLTSFADMSGPTSLMDVVSPVTDVLSYPSRRVGELTEQSNISDPEGGFLKPQIDRYGNYYDAEIASIDPNENLLSRWAKTRSMQAGKVLSKAGLSIAQDPLTLGTVPIKALMSLPRATLEAIQKFSPEIKSMMAQYAGLGQSGAAIERAAIRPQQVIAAQGRADEIAQDIERSVRDIREKDLENVNAMEAAKKGQYESQVAAQKADYEARNLDQEQAYEASQAKRAQSIEGEVLNRRANPGVPIRPFETGERLATGLEAARESVGKKYGDAISGAFEKSGISSLPIGGKQFVGNKAKELHNLRGTPGKATAYNYNPVEEFIDDRMKSLGYDRSVGYRNTEAGSEKLISWMEERAKGAHGLKTVNDVYKWRKNLDIQYANAISGEKALFAKGTPDAIEIRKMRNEANDLVMSIPLKKLEKNNPEVAKAWQDVYTEIRKTYSETMDNMDNIAQAVGKTTSAEEYMAKISNLGVKKVEQLREASRNIPELSAAWRDVQEMSFDNLIRQAIDPRRGNEFSGDKFSSIWNKAMKDNPRMWTALVGEDRALRISHAVRRYESTAATRPSALPRPGAIPKPTKMEPGYSPQYPRLASTGGIEDSKLTRGVVQNISANDKIEAIKELEMLDNLLGKGYKDQALDAWAAKTLQINQGSIPKFSTQPNGGRLLGVLVGSGVGFSAGGPVGFIPGLVIGGYSSSPSAAVAVYKAVNKVNQVNPEFVRNVAKLAPKLRNTATISGSASLLKSKEDSKK